METLTGKHARAAMNGTLFSACNPTPKTTTVGCAAAGWTGLGLCNPTGSGIHIIVHEFYYSKYIVADVEGALGLATTTDAGFGSEIAAKNRLIGGAASSAYVDSAATLTTAGNLIAWVASIGVEAAADDGYMASNGVIELQGALVLPPGYSVITCTDAVQTSVFAFGFMWEEVQSPFGS
jgi:hypothetical protein